MADQRGQKIAVLLSRFRQQCEKGKRPNISDYAEQVAVEARSDMVRELIAIEIEIYGKSGLGGDAELYRRFGDDVYEQAVDALEKTSAASNLEDVPEGDFSTVDLPSREDEFSKDSDLIENYRILQQIGEGGMGTVWMAEQKHPVRRRVAIKQLRSDILHRRDISSKEIIARFEAERQALAMMEHPNIAKVLDAGTTKIGTPYFVMELVKGIPFTKYCDDHRLGIRERLELFVPVCRAIQHAHQKGIIHRDIKPSNILVTETDGKPKPIVIDFGLVKAIDHSTRLTDKTMFTQLGRALGTLQYMSPEQAEPGHLDVDTRTDIYSLGVVLYELLTGSTPLEHARVRELAMHKILEVLRNERPPAPSRRLSSYGITESDVSERRKITPSRLQQLLRGELDWVVMKAIDLDRSRRYPTATSLAEEIERFLEGSPVQARPPSTVYRLSKFVGKNKVVTALTSTIAALLVGGLVSTTWLFLEADEARQTAEAQTIVADEEKAKAIHSSKKALQAQKQADLARFVAAKEKDTAEQNEKRSLEVLRIVTDSFQSRSPFEGEDSKMAATDVLLNSKVFLNESELDQVGKMMLLETLATCFLSIGEYELAIESDSELIALAKKSGRMEDLTILEAKTRLAESTFKNGDPDEAIAMLKSIQDQSEKLYKSDDARYLSLNNNIGAIYSDLGRFREAIEILELVIEERTRILGVDDRKTLVSMSNLGNAYVTAGQFKEAIEIQREVLRYRTKLLGESHPETIYSINNLATALIRTKELVESIALSERALPLSENRLGENHPQTQTLVANLAAMYLETKRPANALEMLQRIYEIQLIRLGKKHGRTLLTMHNLSSAMFQLGKFEEACAMFEETLALRREIYGADNPHTMTTMNMLAGVYQKINRQDEAIALYKETYSLRKKLLGEDHLSTIRSAYGVGQLLLRMDRNKEAVEYLERAVDGRSRLEGPSSKTVLIYKNMLGIGLVRSKGFEQAVVVLQDSMLRTEESRGRKHRETQTALLWLGIAFRGLGELDEAIEALEEFVEVKSRPRLLAQGTKELKAAYVEAKLPDKAATIVLQEVQLNRELVKDDIDALAQLLLSKSSELLQLKFFEDAERFSREAAELWKESQGATWKQFHARSQLGEALHRLKRFDEAKIELLAALEGMQRIPKSVPLDEILKMKKQAIQSLIELAKTNDDKPGIQKWNARLSELGD